MTTAVDTNVIVALWNEDDTLNVAARKALDAAQSRGELVIAAPVFSELLAFPARTEGLVDAFCRETGIAVDWDLKEAVWRLAGLAFQKYTARRRNQGSAGPRGILADFVIGAHADYNGFPLLTLDDRLYRASFPTLRLLRA